MRIAFFSFHPYDKKYFDRNNVPELVNGKHEITYFEVQLNEQTVQLAANFEAVCAFVNDKLNEAVIKSLAGFGIKLIALRSAGFNNVDLIAANACGIPVVRVPAYSPYAVAEHALALIMTLNRKTHKAYNRVREGNFSLDRLVGFDLHGKTIGVIGTGKIGQCFCRIMLGFGCRVLAFDLIANREMEAIGVEYLPLIDILAESHIISLHCPLNDQTRHLMNDATIDMMKDGAMLINTSRGGLLDTQAAISALKRGKLSALGIDVYEQEEKLFFQDHSEDIIQDDIIMRLLSFPNVLITSHQGFFTEEALTQIAAITLQNISDFEQGKGLVNRV